MPTNRRCERSSELPSGPGADLRAVGPPEDHPLRHARAPATPKVARGGLPARDVRDETEEAAMSEAHAAARVQHMVGERASGDLAEGAHRFGQHARHAARPVPPGGGRFPSRRGHRAPDSEHVNRLVVVDPDELGELIESAVARALALRSDAQRAEWLDAAGAAALLGLHRDTVARMARLGELPSSRVGREYRFLRSELSAWIEAGRSGR